LVWPGTHLGSAMGGLVSVVGAGAGAGVIVDMGAP
jgi:hypothetical protein